MSSFFRDGDVVIVHSMDRLARNLDDLRRLVRTDGDRAGRAADHAFTILHERPPSRSL